MVNLSFQILLGATAFPKCKELGILNSPSQFWREL